MVAFRPQATHKIAHRQHLIEEAKKAYAQKLVADKAGGAKERGYHIPCVKLAGVPSGALRRSDWMVTESRTPSVGRKPCQEEGDPDSQASLPGLSPFRVEVRRRTTYRAELKQGSAYVDIS